MPVFFFHIRQQEYLIDDPDGLELPDLAAAIAEAHEDVLALVAECLQNGKTIEPHAISVSDRSGKVLAEITFHDVVLGLIRN